MKCCIAFELVDVLIEFDDQNTHFSVFISQQTYFGDQKNANPNLILRPNENSHFFILDETRMTKKKEC